MHFRHQNNYIQLFKLVKLILYGCLNSYIKKIAYTYIDDKGFSGLWIHRIVTPYTYIHLEEFGE